MDLKNVDFKNLKYEEKQTLIKNLKKEYGCQYGYVNRNYQVVKCRSYNELVVNLGLADWLNHEILLVIQ